MTSLRITIAGRDYDVACDDGQEDHLKRLAHMLDARIRSMGMPVGKTLDSHMLVLASLTLADELQDTAYALEQARHDIANSSQSFEINKQIELENAVASTIHEIANRIEAIASELENTHA